MTTIERHDVDILGDDVACKGCSLKLNTRVWGRSLALRVGKAHVANPHASVEALIGFVSGTAEHGAQRDVATGRPPCPFETPGGSATADDETLLIW